MAITPSQWSHVLTIPESYTPSAATSGQTLVITESVIAKLSASDQLTFWTNVQNGGGDVRICESSDGTNQLPVEIVSLDNIAQTCVIWTRKPTYSGAGDLYLFIGKAGETQPAVTDPFGRNAVWSDFEYCFHFDASGKLVDSAGNHTLIESGDVISVAGKIGQGADAQLNSANFYEIDGYLGVSGGAARTHSMWFKSASGTTGLLEYGTNITRGRYTVLLDNGRFRTEIAGSFTRTNDTTLADGAWHKAVTKESGTGQFPSGNTIVVDGTPQATSDGGEVVIDTAPQSNVHFEINKSLTRANSQFDEYSLRLFETTDATDATEYANQNDPSSFFGTPTLATTGGGGPVLQTLTPTAILSQESFGSSSISLVTQFTSPTSILTQEALGSPTVAIGAVILQPPTIPSQESVEAPTVVVGGIELAVPSIGSEEALGNAIIQSGAIIISAPSIGTEEAFGTAVVNRLLELIEVAGIASQEQFERPVVLGGDRIGIPIPERQTWNRVAKYLRTLKFKGNDNDVICAWLRSEGYEDQYNAMWEAYLEDEGLEGSLTDKYSNWKRQ